MNDCHLRHDDAVSRSIRDDQRVVVLEDMLVNHVVDLVVDGGSDPCGWHFEVSGVGWLKHFGPSSLAMLRMVQFSL